MKKISKQGRDQAAAPCPAWPLVLNSGPTDDLFDAISAGSAHMTRKAMEAIEGGAAMERTTNSGGPESALVGLARLGARREDLPALKALARRLVSGSSTTAREQALSIGVSSKTTRWLVDILLETGTRLSGSGCLDELLEMSQSAAHSTLFRLRAAGWKPSGQPQEILLLEDAIVHRKTTVFSSLMAIYNVEGIDLPAPPADYDSWFHRTMITMAGLKPNQWDGWSALTGCVAVSGLEDLREGDRGILLLNVINEIGTGLGTGVSESMCGLSRDLSECLAIGRAARLGKNTRQAENADPAGKKQMRL